MDFGLTEEQERIRGVAREFARAEVAPHARAIDESAEFSWPIHRRLGELGFLCMTAPEAYGGAGSDTLTWCMVVEEFARVSSAAANGLTLTESMAHYLLTLGTEAQKTAVLPALASGRELCAFGLTEPGVGSDAKAVATTAARTDDAWILNGQKMWISNGGFADLFTVFAKVGGEHFTAFLVERGPGLVSGHEEKKLGIDGSSTTALMLEDCHVPVENVLGEVGRGHKIAFNVLNIGRLKLGARSVGTMKLSLLQSVNYAKERHQFGQAIANFGLIKHKLAEMTIRAYVGESMLYRTAGMIDEALHGVDKDDPRQVLGVLEQYAVECSIIKVWESEALGYVVDEEVQVFGGYGYSRDYPAERAYRDARIARIYEGTNEINRIVIGSQLLRRAKSGDLPLLEAPKAAPDRAAGGAGGPTELEQEMRLLAASKAKTIAAIARADSKYGERVRDEQEILGLIAEMVMDVYAMDSALLRTRRVIEHSGMSRAATQVDIARVFTRDAAGRVERAALAIETETEPDDGAAAELSGNVNAVPLLKAIAARRRIADAIIGAGRYNLS